MDTAAFGSETNPVRADRVKTTEHLTFLVGENQFAAVHTGKKTKHLAPHFHGLCTYSCLKNEKEMELLTNVDISMKRTKICRMWKVIIVHCLHVLNQTFLVKCCKMCM